MTVITFDDIDEYTISINLSFKHSACLHPLQLTNDQQQIPDDVHCLVDIYHKSNKFHINVTKVNDDTFSYDFTFSANVSSNFATKAHILGVIVSMYTLHCVIDT